jgi:cation diffusion facilitator family transporter
MNQLTISLLSTFVNIFLAIFKLLVGLTMGSIALVADAIHSGLDIVSSFVTFLGIKVSKKSIEQKYPYGLHRAEVLAGFIVALLLGVSGIWIIYESIMGFFSEQKVVFSAWAIWITLLSIIVNEIMARLKFYYGSKHKSLSLVADAEHSRADAISSIGVLLGMIAVKYIYYADILIAFGIGIYILKETFSIGKEVTESLLDVANKEVEEKIKRICKARKVEISDLKTRRIGSANFAEIKIKLSSGLKVEKVQKITDTLEDRLLNNIPELSYVVISIEAYDMARSVILPKFGSKMGDIKDFEKIGPKKQGQRIIIPYSDKEISDKFGVLTYYIIDKDETGIKKRHIVKNPYYEKESGHGARFAKAVRADKVLVKKIGDNARNNLKIFGIDVEIIQPKQDLDSILKLYENK